MSRKEGSGLLFASYKLAILLQDFTFVKSPSCCLDGDWKIWMRSGQGYRSAIHERCHAVRRP
jgi:hypothetical protein